MNAAVEAVFPVLRETGRSTDKATLVRSPARSAAQRADTPRAKRVHQRITNLMTGGKMLGIFATREMQASDFI
jgi:hypothetical protein